MKASATIDASHTETASPGHRAPSGFSWVALWTLYTLTFRQHVHGRRWIVMGVLFLLPPGLAVLIRATSNEMPKVVIEFLLAYLFIPQALLPLLALVYAAGIIQDEQEDQTLTYLLIRPIPRWAIYVVKLLATLTTTVLLTIVLTSVTFTAIYVGSDVGFTTVAKRCLTTVGVHCLAVVAYCCLFGLIGLYSKRALIAGILYTAVIEGLLANLPFGLRLITVIYYSRILAYRSMDFVFTRRGNSHDVADAAWQLDVQTDPELLKHPSAMTCFAVLAVASIACTLIGALMCRRREFHVKTPEGN